MSAVREVAEALGVGAFEAGIGRDPMLVSEISKIVSGLPQGDPIKADVYSGYVTGWDRAKGGTS